MLIRFRSPGARGLLASLLCLLAGTHLTAQCNSGPRWTPSGGNPSAGNPGSPNPGSPSSPNPGGPTTPNPGTPGNPGPGQPTTGGPGNGPTTGGPGGPPAGARAGRSAARGMVMTFERGITSKDRLRFDWEHPVPPQADSGTSAAGAMPLDDALATLWGDDARPLLVLRECDLCAGTDLPLLKQAGNNERTMLLTRWFKIVKLPAHVGDASHPFHNVFAGHDFGDAAPHFYLLAHPGAAPIAFTGAPTQSQLWRSMSRVVKDRYQLDPDQALKKWLKLLDQFDQNDAARLHAKEQLRASRADSGPRSSRTRKLQAQVDDLQMELAKLIAQEKKVTDLLLKPFPAPEKAGAR